MRRRNFLQVLGLLIAAPLTAGRTLHRSPTNPFLAKKALSVPSQGKIWLDPSGSQEIPYLFQWYDDFLKMPWELMHDHVFYGALHSDGKLVKVGDHFRMGVETWLMYDKTPSGGLLGKRVADCGDTPSVPQRILKIDPEVG